MKLLISNAQVCDIRSPFHGKICSIWVSGGTIEQILPSSKKEQITPKGYKVIDAKGQLIMPGLVDMRADFCDPGNEQKESLQTGANAALHGGFTNVVLLPATLPVRDSKIGIEYVLNQSHKLPIHVHAYGCLSHNREGKEMAELYDMSLAGALGFTDGNRSIANSGLLMRSLLYTKIFNGLNLVLANDAYLSEGGRMHEGNVSTLLGLKGIPSLAENTMVQRDIELVKYSGGKLHFSTITTKESVELIRKAKKQGLPITCDVAFANLCFTHENLAEYDANFKLQPPLRSKNDQKALWDGVQDGTIDAIVSNHHPQNKESKEVEFEYALPGMITLQTLLPYLLSTKPNTVSTEKVIEALSANPREILGLPLLSIEETAIANFVLYQEDKTWVYSKNYSRSENSPLLGKTITGAITHVVCKDQLHQF